MPINPNLVPAVPVPFRSDGALDGPRLEPLLRVTPVRRCRRRLRLRDDRRVPDPGRRRARRGPLRGARGLRPRPGVRARRRGVRSPGRTAHGTRGDARGAEPRRDHPVLPPGRAAVAQGVLPAGYATEAGDDARLFVYLYASRTTTAVTPEQLAELATIPSVVGVKISGEPSARVLEYRGRARRVRGLLRQRRRVRERRPGGLRRRRLGGLQCLPTALRRPARRAAPGGRRRRDRRPGRRAAGGRCRRRERRPDQDGAGRTRPAGRAAPRRARARRRPNSSTGSPRPSRSCVEPRRDLPDRPLAGLRPPHRARPGCARTRRSCRSTASGASGGRPPGSRTASWGTLPVPAHWVLHGLSDGLGNSTAPYGRPQYTNVIYPFPVDPPHIPDENPTGEYRRRFDRPDWADSGERCCCGSTGSSRSTGSG